MSGAFAGMVHEGDGGVMVALQRSQISKDRRDFTGDVLVDGVQTDERIEDQEFRLQAGHGGLQRLLVFGSVEPQRWCNDDVDIKAFEIDAGGVCDTLKALAHNEGSILGGIEQHSAPLPGRKASQAGCAGSHCDSKIEGEERLPALGLATDDTDGLRAP